MRDPKIVILVDDFKLGPLTVEQANKLCDALCEVLDTVDPQDEEPDDFSVGFHGGVDCGLRIAFDRGLQECQN